MEEPREENSNSQSPLKQIRTFQGDAVEALQRQKESLVSIQRGEQIKRGLSGTSAQTANQDSTGGKEFFLLLLGSLILFALGAAGTWYVYGEFTRKTATQTVGIPANRFISANSEVNLDFQTLTRDSLINTVSNTINDIPDSELRHIILRKAAEDKLAVLSTSEFLSALESKAPGSLVRAFDPLFMFGNYRASTFIIIRLSSFENAFAGMLAWEKDLARDIGPLFATSGLLRDIAPESVFIDTIDRNKDIRMLAFEDQVVLLYSFFDNNMLIITDSIETLRTIIDRLTREKLSR
ncbi:MAG: hypothetical protein HYT68_00160 [Candidatus Zambryskibacteria bacterium]|nr:hypothetical protein [Candidatus Zambryskibacteria bacterium]